MLKKTFLVRNRCRQLWRLLRVIVVLSLYGNHSLLLCATGRNARGHQRSLSESAISRLSFLPLQSGDRIFARPSPDQESSVDQEPSPDREPTVDQEPAVLVSPPSEAVGEPHSAFKDPRATKHPHREDRPKRTLLEYIYGRPDASPMLGDSSSTSPFQDLQRRSLPPSQLASTTASPSIEPGAQIPISGRSSAPGILRKRELPALPRGPSRGGVSSQKHSPVPDLMAIACRPESQAGNSRVEPQADNNTAADSQQVSLMSLAMSRAIPYTESGGSEENSEDDGSGTPIFNKNDPLSFYIKAPGAYSLEELLDTMSPEDISAVESVTGIGGEALLHALESHLYIQPH